MVRALARVNLARIERNAARLRASLSPGAALCAVVKADGYGHGAVPVARAAIAGGASWLAVATAGEAEQLSAAGVDARILVMGAVSDEELPAALRSGADLVAWSSEFVDGLLAGASSPARVHVKLDTGMGRLGTRDVKAALALADRIAAAAPQLELAGALTHFATSDEDLPFLGAQLAAFKPFVEELRRRHPSSDLVVSAANSAAVLREPGSHFDLVRSGIAIYGCDPMHVDPAVHGLEPALELTSYIAAVKLAAAGESVGYGRRFVAQRDTWIGTVPVGYGDGVRRALTNNCDVLVAGRRYQLVGTVSMDNITIDLGPLTDVTVGARATLIGVDGAERQTAEDIARRIDTINYEVLCGISARVPREYHRDGRPA
jgi:alanine racemase